MGSIAIHRYTTPEAEVWDDVVSGSLNGTFMHTRHFLSYHGDRFEDRSIVVTIDEVAAAVLPAAIDPVDPSRIVSHPGLSYGGLVRDRRLMGESVVEVLDLVRKEFSAEFETLRYKPVPSVYHQRPMDDESYALFRAEAFRFRCDIAVAIRLADSPGLNSNRRRSLRRVKTAGLELRTDLVHLPAYWAVLTERLADAHSAAPVHSLSEMTGLAAQFPEEIGLVVALDDGAVCGGVVLFDSPTSSMAQYIASNEDGRTNGALDLVFEACIESARASGKQWFNFGTCNEQQGRVLNQSLFDFKVSFGGGALIQEQFDIPLR